MSPGSLQGLVVATEDVEATHKKLVDKGVHFDMPPTDLPSGTQAAFRDLEGNGFVLWQRQ